MEEYIKLKNSIDTFNQHWRDGTLKELKTELPQLVDGDKGIVFQVFKKIRWNLHKIF